MATLEGDTGFADSEVEDGFAPDDPFAPGSLAWRLPWAETGEGDLLTPTEALETFLEWVYDREVEPWPHQEDALMDLAVGNSVILGTPTGSGKSLVAQGLCFMAVATGRRAYYTAPIKALVSEKFFDLVDIMGRDNVGMITGDVALNTDAPIICCTAEILANEALRYGEQADVGCVIMDEFHYYGDPQRGWAWQVPLLELPQSQFLLMSATLGDTTSIAHALSERTGRSVDLVAHAERPVPLAYEYSLDALEATVELAARNNDTPLYIVHFSQDAAMTSAQNLASYGVTSKAHREELKKATKGVRFTTAFGKILQRLLEAGIGVHHAGMLPRYRLLVEKLAQKGLLPVICGTDTLGVGINVPIHTVVLTALSKYDGTKTRRLRAREFHQIAGRAGRSGFDTEGLVIAEAPEHEIENAKLIAKAGGDPKKLRKLHKKQAPEGFVGWSEETFKKLVDSPPETLKPHLRITNAMILELVARGGDARASVNKLIDRSAQTDEQKTELRARAEEIFTTLIEGGVVVVEPDEDGNDSYRLTVELPDDFAMDQPLAPFLLAALDLFDFADEHYALDVISLVEATLENPRQVLRAQEKQAREKAIAEMKADGIEYEERMERLEEVTYPKPLEDELYGAFAQYCKAVPWAADYELQPKSVLRDMIETASDFKTYVNRYNIARFEGILLRYLSDAYRVLDKTIPESRRDEMLWDYIAWLGLLVRTTDSSLVDEWQNMGIMPEDDVVPPQAADAVVADRRAMTVLVRNALFARIRLAAMDKAAELGRMDSAWGFGERKWADVLDVFYDAHESLRIDGDARSAAYLVIDERDEALDHVWHVRQIFCDSDGDADFCIVADVDLDATQEQGEVIFATYWVGVVDELGLTE